jgi:hypothetical protein
MEDAADRFYSLMRQEGEAAEGGPEDCNDPYWRLQELGIFACQYLNGGLHQWYSNPSGAAWREAVLAISDIGFPGLAQSLTTMCESLDESMGDRWQLDYNGWLSDAESETIDEFTEPYQDLPQRLLDDGSFYTQTWDWWEGVLARGETTRSPR